MAVRQDQVQLRVDFITDESKQLAKTLLTTKQYSDEINRSTTAIKQYERELAKKNVTEAKRAEIMAKIAVEEQKVATNLSRIAAEGKKVEALDLTKIAPQQLIDRARQLEAAMKRIPASAPEFQSLQSQLAAVNGRLRELRASSQGLNPGGGGGGFIESIIGGAGRGIALLGVLTTAWQALTAAFSGANKLEQLTISFETFLGSAEAAKAVIADLKAFEVRTPFEAEQVNNAGRALLAFGFSTEELIPTLTRVGDVAAGTGKDFNELALIYGKAKTQGLIQGEELNQLAEAGIPIYAELAKVVGVSEKEIRKLGEQGKLQFSDLEQVFVNLTSEGGKFAGLMERQSKSIGGLYSTLKSQFSNLLASLGTALAPALKELLSGLIEISNTAGKVLVPAFDIVGKSVQGLVFLVKDLYSLLTPQRLQSIVSALGTAFQPLVTIYQAYQAISGRQAAAKKELEQFYADRDRYEQERDDRQLSAEERQAIREKEEERAKLVAERQQAIREAAEKRANEAFERELKRVEAEGARKALLLEADRLNDKVSEEQYQTELTRLKEEGLKRQLEVYAQFRRAQTNEALELQNELLQIEANRRDRAANGPLPALPGTGLSGPVTSQTAGAGQAGQVAGIGQDAAQVALRQKFEQALITEQEYQLKSLELKRLFIEEELALLRASEQPNTEAIQRKEEAKLKVEEQIALKRQENEERLQRAKDAIYQAGFDSFNEGINLGIQLLSKDEAARKKHASVIKAFEIGQVVAAGITEVQKIYAKNAGLPGGFLISLAESAPSILRTTTAIVRIANQKFARGGDTGPGFGSPDETGHRPAGVVHANEYVVPAWMRSDPDVRGALGWIESKRLRGYADGGLVSVNTTPSLPPSSVGIADQGLQSARLIQEAAMMIVQAANAIPRQVRASVSYLDIEEVGVDLNQVRSEAAI